MEKDEPGVAFAGLFKGKRHEMVKIAQGGNHENCVRMRPAARFGVPHGEHLILRSAALAEGPGCAIEYLET